MRTITLQLEHYTSTEEYWAAYTNGGTRACGRSPAEALHNLRNDCCTLARSPAALFRERILLTERRLLSSFIDWEAASEGRIGWGDTPEEALRSWQRDCKERPWDPAEDCPTCPGHKSGPHKMSCSLTKGYPREVS